MNLALIRSLLKVARLEHARSGRSTLALLYDIVRCRRLYGTDLVDYMAYGFSMLGAEARWRYFSGHDLYLVANSVNNRSQDNKWTSYQLLKPYYKRAMVHLLESSAGEVDAFLEEQETFFAKTLEGCGGYGVAYVEQKDYASRKALLADLKSKEMFLLEEPIRQHPALNQITEVSVNTLRVLSVRSKEGEIAFLPTVLRVGLGKLKVDNVSSGGTYTFLDENGIIGLDAYYQENLDYIKGSEICLEVHPQTGFRPKGFQVPFYKETIQMVEEMAKQLPDCPLLGWDIAITEEGPKLLEFNAFPAIAFNQNYYFTKVLGKSDVGAKPLIEQQLGMKIQFEHRLGKASRVSLEK